MYSLNLFETVDEEATATDSPLNDELIQTFHSWKSEFPLLNPFLFAFGGYVIATDVLLRDFNSFLEANDLNRYRKRISLLSKSIFIQQFYNTPETRIQIRGISFFNRLFNKWLANGPFVVSQTVMCVATNSNQSSSHLGISILPDVSIELHGKGILCVEIIYSTGLEAGHRRIRELFRLPHVRSVLVIYIRYPWDQTVHLDAYKEADGELFFLQYNRPAEGEVAVPERVVSFGNTCPSADDLADVGELTEFDPRGIEGHVKNGGVSCSEKNKSLDFFNILIPPKIILESDVGTGNTIIDQPLRLIENQFKFSINLYDLQCWFRAAIHEMNQLILNDEASCNVSYPRIY